MCEAKYKNQTLHSLPLSNIYQMPSKLARTSYSAAEKLEIIDYALLENQAKAAFKFGIHKSMVSRWIRDFRKIQSADPENRRIGSGRHKKRRIEAELPVAAYESDGEKTLTGEQDDLEDYQHNKSYACTGFCTI